MKIIFSHPTGNANVRSAAAGIQSRGNLQSFHTSIGVFQGGLLDRLSALPGMGELQRRKFDSSLKTPCLQFPWIEGGRLLATKFGFQSLIAHEQGFFCIDEVYKKHDRWVSRVLEKSTEAHGDRYAVYAYEDGALQSFQAAKQRGITCLYDLPIGYWRAARRLLEGERERWPEWASTLTGFRDSEKKLERKDSELLMADRIFVASSFTKKSLEDFRGKLGPIEVIPYGFPPVHEGRNYTGHVGSRPLKLLFVGGLSQRKGIADLFQVVESLGKRVELTVVGGKTTENCPALDQALSRHRWIPSLPHGKILELMREHDVFVFPSLFEGFGLVITEAMSQGTPVITTDRTAGPDLIQHGTNGWLIEAGKTSALQEMIEELVVNPDQIASVGKEAMESARKRPWKVYGDELAESLTRSI